MACNTPAEAHAWDQFLIDLPGVHWEQTTAWGTVKQLYGWQPTWIWVARGDQILGGALILTRKVGRFTTIGYVARGPVWDESDSDSMRLATEALCQFATSLRLTYLAIVPPYKGEILIPLLRSLHFRPKPDFLPPTGVGKATLVIDLQQDLDAIFAGMSMTKRQNVRRATRKGVKVRIGDAQEAQAVWQLMKQTCARRGISPSPPQDDFFTNTYRILAPIGVATFFVAEIGSEVVSGACAMVFGGTMQLWRVGWSGKYDKYDPNDILHWEMIKWAKENGCREFDFMHIRPDHARALLRGEKLNDSYSGVTDFKMGFGGQIRLLPEICWRSFAPAIDRAMCLGAAKVVESRLGRSVLIKAARRFRIT